MNDPRPHFASEPAVDLGDAGVAVLGCGSVGGLATWCLAGAGVGRLELADRDRVAPENLRRHLCGAADLGQPKPAAVARFLSERYPALRADAAETCFLKDPERLRRLIDAAEVLLVAVDGEGPKHLIESIAWELRRAAVYAGVYGGGWGAEVILVDPQRGTPCYACAARTMGRAGIAVWPQESNPAYALPAPAAGGPGWVQADLTSIMPAAALAARLTAAWLAARRGHERGWQEFRQQGATAWRLALRRVPAWESGPWGLEPVVVRRQPDCPLCAAGRGADGLERFGALLDDDSAGEN